ncbi:MAG: isochorismatase family protein [Rhodoferax sp.]|jgi:nicotinamidase-related amidase|uniref:cysteine hydrolase family protein n=1 Tax=Rhodoferax sp. TaxID=50421 RepID=UPI001B74A15F|nr:isochorismatase family protein [Rhodoferax sp.]MBP9149624.1 isochorismatase family protein [Rhodoferax sp.]MBP9735675.1 isochorismatase family protein [Rhodoferax sp.]
MKTCLLLIDAQESFRQRQYFTVTDLPTYLAAQNKLIDACLATNVPIVRVFHVDGPNNALNPFSHESGFVRPLAELHCFEAALTVYKSRHSALVGTGLDVWLTQNGIQKLIISGIRTEQCCETTTRHASDLGWQVDFCLEATLTWDMQHLDGSVLHAADIKSRTAAVLKDRFATICTAQQALERAVEVPA